MARTTRRRSSPRRSTRPSAPTGGRDPAPGRARTPGGCAARGIPGSGVAGLGNRGHGGFTEALLGSVGQHLVQHAACPVVVVRGPADAMRSGPY
ncbi:universal stress protein [Streptomyces sp. NPDC001292]|uniref:universal stress protein n=1 Tax=Streptomyces sp. NPDC001292 TaxID=3364558 RepID=UPI0036B30ECD